jgi:hypothetical protein
MDETNEIYDAQRRDLIRDGMAQARERMDRDAGLRREWEDDGWPDALDFDRASGLHVVEVVEVFEDRPPRG